VRPSRFATWYAALSRLEIGIIVLLAILYALMLTGGGSGSRRENARRQEALTVARSAAAALNNYRADYGHFPALGQPRSTTEKFVLFGERAAGCSQDNGAVFDTLRSIPRGPNANDALNPRQVKYYEGKKATDPKLPRDGFADGAEFPAQIQGRLYDPWGGQYCVLWETDNDSFIDVSPIFQDLTGPENTIKVRTAVFSLAHDGELGGKGYAGRYQKEKSSTPNDIVSWE
jgi:type II secretory pathway pseudopilin PulG